MGVTSSGSLQSRELHNMTSGVAGWLPALQLRACPLWQMQREGETIRRLRPLERYKRNIPVPSDARNAEKLVDSP